MSMINSRIRQGAKGPGKRDIVLLTYWVVRRHPFKKAVDGKKKLPVGGRVGEF